MTQQHEILGYQLEEFYETHAEWYKVKKPPTEMFKLVAKLAEELGEVSEAVLAVSGSVKKTAKLKEKGASPNEALKEELGDILITMMNLLKADGVKAGTLTEILELACIKMRKSIAKERK